MKLKLCGLTELDQLEKANELGIKYGGMIFYEHSPRYVGNKMTGKEVRDMHLTIKKTGVFVNASVDDIFRRVDEYELDLVQLHGDETPSFCNRISDKVPVIKAFRVNQKNEQNMDWIISPFFDFCDFYLFDTGNEWSYGGTGEKFNWKLLEDSKIDKPFFLSGGIGPDDISVIQSFEHPYLHAIDINSKFEISPGIKDMLLVEKFMDELFVKH